MQAPVQLSDPFTDVSDLEVRIHHCSLRFLTNQQSYLIFGL